MGMLLNVIVVDMVVIEGSRINLVDAWTVILKKENNVSNVKTPV